MKKLINITDKSIENNFYNSNKLTKKLIIDISNGNFTAINYGSKTSKICFEYTINDPLFFSLNRLLGSKGKLSINNESKSLNILKKNNTIYVVFGSKKDFEIINVSINIIDAKTKQELYDYINLKNMLWEFFEDSKNIVQNYHQYTLDEYYEVIHEENNPFLIGKRKTKKSWECCRNCYFKIDENVWKEAFLQEYHGMYDDYLDLEDVIGYCEFGYNMDQLHEMDYWCPNYMSEEEYIRARISTYKMQYLELKSSFFLSNYAFIILTLLFFTYFINKGGKKYE